MSVEDRNPRICLVCTARGIHRVFDGDAPATAVTEHYIRKHATPSELPLLQRVLDYIAPRNL
jgi:hypothetical protein